MTTEHTENAEITTNPEHSGPENVPSQSVEDQGRALYERGMQYINGNGVEQNFGMAIASFLDGTDIDHPDCILKASLVYFLGAGVGRNLETAKMYAKKYCSVAPNGAYVQIANEIISESLGAFNAREYLIGEQPLAQSENVAAAHSGIQPEPKFRVILVAAVFAILVVGVVAIYTFKDSLFGRSLGDGKIDISDIISDADSKAARDQALIVSARLIANADERKKAIQQQETARKEAEAAEEKAKEQALEQARLAKEAERVRLEQEAKARADMEVARQQQRAAMENSRSRSSYNSDVNNQQVNQMYQSAIIAMNQGQYDRANGIVDSLLQAYPGNPNLVKLKNDIQLAKQTALRRIVIH